VAKGQELQSIESLRPRLDGDWNQAQRRLFAGLNRGLDNLAARIVENASSLGELQSIIGDARPLLARAADAQRQQAQIAAAQSMHPRLPACAPISASSWTRAVTNRHTLTSAPVYVCADCRQPFSEPDHDDSDGGDYCPNPDRGEWLVPDVNWLDAEALDSLPPESRPTWWDVLRGVLRP
jgi:hypothetical protein